MPKNQRPARIPHSFDLTGGEGITILNADGTTTRVKGNPPSFAAVGYSLTDQPQTVAQLAEAGQVSRSAASKALKLLEDKGYAERDSSTSPETWIVGMPQSAPRKAPVPDGWKRLASIREEVLVSLAEAAGAGLTPHAMSKRTGRSSGAITNAAEKLLREGVIALDSPKPRAYSALDGG